MRIIGYLDIPGLVVTVFKNENRLSVKFEKNLLEQTFKVRDDVNLSGLNEVKKLFDAQWINEIEAQFDKMENDRNAALHRYDNLLEEDAEPEIF